MRHLRFLTLLTIFAITHVAKADEDNDPLTNTAQTIANLITDKPDVSEELFAPSFIAAVPPNKLAELCQQLHGKYGPVTDVRLQSRQTSVAGKFVFRFASHEMPVTLHLDGRTNKVIGLWFGTPTPAVASIDAVIKKLAELPGQTSLQLVQLGEEPVILQSLDPDEPLAIGSTFKLVVLAAIVHNNLPWDQVIRLKADYRSLPTGEMRDWPAGSPVTVHTLALKMISQSDNTATDHLIHLLGREKIESVQQTIGISNPARNVPFLTTADMFRIKSDDELLAKYVAADASARRALLAKEIPAQPLDLSKVDLAAPKAIDQVEWFASTADLCRVMAWFAEKNDRTALDILAINPGLQPDRQKLPYVGYKGGSEAGVLSMTWLIKTADGRMLALSATWNNPAAPLNDAQFFGLMQAILNHLGPDNPDN